MGHGQKAGKSFPPYRLASQVRKITAKLLPSEEELGAGTVLTTRKGTAIQLGKLIGQGGEGSIFATDKPDLVAKLYRKDNLTQSRYEKLKIMVSKGLNWLNPAAEGICWPRGLLFDARGDFRGYVMNKAGGEPISSLFINKKRERLFPHWNRHHLAELCITILNKVNLLHSSNIIIGDINPQNVLVEKENRIFLVDTDSYQVEGFPCPVGTVHFTPPELQGVNFSNVLRTKEHEAFAVATLLFMILLLGKQPYARQGGDSLNQGIQDMAFSYPLGEKTNRKAPGGPWRYIWSNLPFRLKEAFYETFHCKSRMKSETGAG